MILRKALQPILRTLSNTSQRFFSSQNPTNQQGTINSLSQLAQRAVWASLVMRSIYNAPKTTNIMDPSLREKMLNIKIQDLHGVKHELFDNKVKQNFLEIFTKGIFLNPIIFNQAHVTQAEQLIKQKKNDKQLPTEHQPVIFCPNVLVTKQVFSHLWTHGLDMMICGVYGISKTFAIIFFWHLTSIINTFIFQASSSKKLQEELNYLKQFDMFSSPVPKCFYWSMDKTKNQQISDLKKIIIEHLIQFPLSQSDKAKLVKIPSFKKFLKKIKSLYSQAGIDTIIIVDQINQLAGSIRQWNKFISQIEEKLKDIERSIKLLQQDISNLRQPSAQEKRDPQIFIASANGHIQTLKKESTKILRNYKKDLKKFMDKFKIPAERLTQLVEQFKSIGSYHYYNSSINIQRDIFKMDIENTSFNLQRKISLANLNNQQSHRRRLTKTIKFQELLKQEWGRVDFYHFYWFEILRKIISRKQQKDVQQWKKQFYEAVKDKDLKHYYRFIFIRQYLDTIDVWQKMNSDRSNFLKQSINKFNQFCLELSRNRIKAFLGTGTVEELALKKRFLQILFSLAQIYYQQGKKVLKFTKKNLQDNIGKDITYFLLSRQHNKQLLPSEQDQTSIIFLWSTQQFIEIIHTVIDKTYGYSEQQKKDITENPVVQGCAFQRSIRKALQVEGSIFKFSRGQRLPAQLNPYLIYSCEDFIPFNQNLTVNSVGISLERNLSSVLQKAKQSPQRSILGLPYRQVKDNKRWFAWKSICIDFLIINYVPQLKLFQVFTFDVTISHNLSTKIKDATKLFSSFNYNLTDSNDKININHVILSPPNSRQNIKINENFQIQFSSIDDIEISNTDLKHQINFQYLQKLNIDQRKAIAALSK